MSGESVRGGAGGYGDGDVDVDVDVSVSVHGVSSMGDSVDLSWVSFMMMTRPVTRPVMPREYYIYTSHAS